MWHQVDGPGIWRVHRLVALVGSRIVVVGGGGYPSCRRTCLFLDYRIFRQQSDSGRSNQARQGSEGGEIVENGARIDELRRDSGDAGRNGGEIEGEEGGAELQEGGDW
ncbi:hypothetical protein Ancab_002294 [Ancistrocladus abbreviatus]